MPAWMDDDLRQRRRQGLYRVRRRLETGQGAHVRIAGRDCVNFASNDYLGLAGDPRLARAAARAARRFGAGAGASPLVSGWLPPLRALERELARFEGTEAALVLPSGFAANLATISTLAGKPDAVFSDALNHASLIDGCHLARARVHIYHHLDTKHLEQLLAVHGGSARRRLIVSESVFSMDGDVAPLAELLELARRYDALLVLDEAHATGVLGDQGRGLAECLPAGDRSDERLVKVGTLSKALASQGGFVCGSRRLMRFMVNHARPYIFSTALAPPAAAAARVALRIVAEEPRRRQRLLELARRLHRALRESGWTVGGCQSAIVPVILRAPRAATALSRKLQQAGLLVPAIRPPSVPEGTSRLRISATSEHTDDDIRYLVEAMNSHRKLVGSGPSHGAL